MWQTVGENIARYRNYPRVVGETGGKDFIVAHPSADAEALATAILRGSFEYQGQKCSAASRVFAPASLWPQVREQVAEEIGEMKMGDVADFSNFVGAVIDASSFATQKEAIEEAKAADGKASIVAGGGYDDSDGWFVQPTVIETSDPDFRTMKEELFGPVVTAFVYDDSRYEDTLDLVDQGTSYGLTGAVFARDLARSRRRGSGSATRPATSTSTTSRREPSSASSRSAAHARPARTTRRARCGT